MTVTSEINRNGPYTGDGVNKVFGRGFLALSADHIKVYQTIDGSTSEVTAGITKTNIGAQSGDVIFDTAPAVGVEITLILEVPYLQQSDYSNQGTVEPEQVERDLDLAAMRDLTLKERLDRSFYAPVTGKAFTVGHVPQFNEQGDLEDGPSATQVANAQSFAEAASDSADLAAENASVLQGDGRPALISEISGKTYTNGRIAHDGRVSYVYSSGASSIPDMPNWVAYGTASVLHYGATGAGLVSDVPAFVLALSAHKRVFVPRPASSYLMSAVLLLNDGNTLYGEGADNTFLVFGSNTGGIVSPDANEYCVIQDLSLQGTGATGTVGIQIISNTRRTTVKNCRITQFGAPGNGAGISLEDSGFGGTPDEDMWSAQVDNNNVESCGRGIVFLNARHILLSNNTVRRCKGTTYYLEDSETVRMVIASGENSNTSHGASTSWALHLKNCRDITADIDSENLIDGLVLLDGTSASEVRLRGGTADAGASMIKLINNSRANKFSGGLGGLWDAGHIGIDIEAGSNNNEFGPIVIGLEGTIDPGATLISDNGTDNTFNVIKGDGTLVRMGGTDMTGSDANGEFTKHPDGTLTCWHKIQLSYSAPSLMFASWTFPHACKDATEYAITGNVDTDTISGLTPAADQLCGVTTGRGNFATGEISLCRQADQTDFGVSDTVDVFVRLTGRWR